MGKNIKPDEWLRNEKKRIRRRNSKQKQKMREQIYLNIDHTK